MIYNEGGRFFGYGLYLLKGRPTYTDNLLGLKRTKWQGPALSAGKHTIEFDFKYDGLGAGTLAYNNVSGVGQGGTGTLKVDGKAVATQKLEHTLPLAKPLDDVVNIGDAAGTPVDDNDYHIPFKFTGKINKLTITLEPPQLTPEDIKKLKEAAARQGADA
jgi:arylsulfatase